MFRVFDFVNNSERKDIHILTDTAYSSAQLFVAAQHFPIRCAVFAPKKGVDFGCTQLGSSGNTAGALQPTGIEQKGLLVTLRVLEFESCSI